MLAYKQNVSDYIFFVLFKQAYIDHYASFNVLMSFHSLNIAQLETT